MTLLGEDKIRKLYSFENVSHALSFGIVEKEIEYLIGEKTININTNIRPWSMDKFYELKERNQIILIKAEEIVYYDFWAADSPKFKRDCEEWIDFYEKYWFAWKLCEHAKMKGYPWISNPANLAARKSKAQLEEIENEILLG